MTEHQKVKAILISSIILYSLDNHLNRKDKAKGSVIRAKQKMLGRLRKEKRTDLIEASNELWANVIDHYKDKNVRIYVADFIEFLIMENYDSLVAYYGEAAIYQFLRMTQNIMEFGIDK